MRLIDADGLLEWAMADVRISFDDRTAIALAVYEAPTIEAEPRQAKWEIDCAGFYVCSECESRAVWNYAREQELTPYCPYCGARMENKNDSRT